jgi:hypothetical protein
MLIGAMFAVLLLTGAGCGDGPVFPEDERVLSRGSDGPDVPEGVPVPDDAGQWDPEVRKQHQQEEEEKEAEEEKEEEKQEVIKDAGRIADVLIEHIYKGDFETALKKFDEFKAAFVAVADENMMHENPRVREGYSLWREEILRTIQILKDDSLTPEKKKSKAQTALVNAGRGKQGAELAKRQE